MVVSRFYNNRLDRNSTGRKRIEEWAAAGTALRSGGRAEPSNLASLRLVRRLYEDCHRVPKLHGHRVFLSRTVDLFIHY